jgi:hypothetical protein
MSLDEFRPETRTWEFVAVLNTLDDSLVGPRASVGTSQIDNRAVAGSHRRHSRNQPFKSSSLALSFGSLSQSGLVAPEGFGHDVVSDSISGLVVRRTWAEKSSF